MKEKDIEKNTVKEIQQEFYPREETCPFCGKKYICYGYSQTICSNCLNEYADCISTVDLYD